MILQLLKPSSNKMRFTLLLVSLFVVNVYSSAQSLIWAPDPPQGSVESQKLAPTDPNAVRVLSVLRAYVGKYLSKTRFSDVYIVDSEPDLSSLLPDWHFYRLREVIGTTSSPEQSIALVTTNVGLSSTGSIVLPREGDNVEFGNLLKAARIPARTESQRLAIRNAYRALYGNKTEDIAVVVQSPDAAGPERPPGSVSLVLEVDAEGLVSGAKIHVVRR